MKRKYEAIRDDLLKWPPHWGPDWPLIKEAADAINDLLIAKADMFEERRKIQEHNAELLLLLEQAKKFIDTHKAP